MRLSFTNRLDYMSRLYEMHKGALGFTVHSLADFLPGILILLEAKKVRSVIQSVSQSIDHVIISMTEHKFSTPS